MTAPFNIRLGGYARERAHVRGAMQALHMQVDVMARFALGLTRAAIAGARVMGRMRRNGQHMAKALRALSAYRERAYHLRLQGDLYANCDWLSRVIEDLGGARKVASVQARLRRVAILRGSAEARSEARSEGRSEGGAGRETRSPDLGPDLGSDLGPDLVPRPSAPSSRSYREQGRVWVDPARCDFDGLFRLAPIARPSQISAKTRKAVRRGLGAQARVRRSGLASSDYAPSGYGPSALWPLDIQMARCAHMMARRSSVRARHRPPSVFAAPRVGAGAGLERTQRERAKPCAQHAPIRAAP